MKNYMKSSILWDTTPHFPLTINRRLVRTCRLHFACYLLLAVFYLGLFFDPKMEATCSSETSVDFQPTTWRYTPEYRTLHNHNSKKLKYYRETTWLWTMTFERSWRKWPWLVLRYLSGYGKKIWNLSQKYHRMRYSSTSLYFPENFSSKLIFVKIIIWCW
jgi:hypothetical protein